jgi:uncharacterized protein YcfJ
MKSGYLLAPLTLALSMALLAPAAGAQPYGPRNEGVSYGYASVLRVTPAYESYHTTEQQCDDGGYQRVHKDTTGGTIVGAIVGGALGNTVGKGDGRKAATVAGAVAGGVIGHEVAKNSDSGYYQPGACRMVDVVHDDGRPAGYDVEYSYKGDVYVARMSYDPGNRIRVRVSVVPADGDMPPPPPPPRHR